MTADEIRVADRLARLEERLGHVESMVTALKLAVNVPWAKIIGAIFTHLIVVLTLVAAGYRYDQDLRQKARDARFESIGSKLDHLADDVRNLRAIVADAVIDHLDPADRPTRR